MSIDNADWIETVEFSPYKCFVHSDKLNALAQGRDVYPVTVEIDPVDFCNHRCGWCVDPFHGNHVLETGFIMSLLKELHEIHVQGVVFKGGGEPTLHADFASIIRYAKKQDFEVGVVTNGSRLEELACAVNENASYLRVSLDGPTKESHHRVHGTDDFDKIISGVRTLVKERGSARHPVIGLSFAMDFHALPFVRTAVDLGEDLGVDYILFRTPFFDEVGRKSTMTLEQTSEVRDRFITVRREYKGKLKIWVDFWISDREALIKAEFCGESPRRGSLFGKNSNGIEHMTGQCLASPLMAVVTADQTLYPCCNLRGLSQWAVGRIDYYRSMSFRKLWKGKERSQVLKRIQSAECIGHCTHPISRYNEIIHYLQGPKYHSGFV